MNATNWVVAIRSYNAGKCKTKYFETNTSPLNNNTGECDGTHDVHGRFTQPFALLVHRFHFQLVRFQFHFEYAVLLLQGIDPFLHLFPGDGRRRHHDGTAVDGRRVALAGAVRHRCRQNEPVGRTRRRRTRNATGGSPLKWRPRVMNRGPESSDAHTPRGSAPTDTYANG